MAITPTSMLKLLRDVDNHVHCLAARRATKGGDPGMTLEEWDRIYDRLLRFVGTAHAKRLIKLLQK
jgi:hypothetical protein